MVLYYAGNEVENDKGFYCRTGNASGSSETGR